MTKDDDLSARLQHLEEMFDDLRGQLPLLREQIAQVSALLERSLRFWTKEEG